MNNKWALILMTKGSKVRRKSWGERAYLYIDSFGFIRQSWNCEKVDWNTKASERADDWEKY